MFRVIAPVQANVWKVTSMLKPLWPRKSSADTSGYASLQRRHAAWFGLTRPGYPGSPGPAPERVIPGVPVEVVYVEAAPDAVVLAASDRGVVTVAAEDAVVAPVAVQGVVAGAAPQVVSAVSAIGSCRRPAAPQQVVAIARTDEGRVAASFGSR